ncbi:MAG: rhodanese-related sulfurtransferase [Nanoarchaeota archaeon]|nr:rhodanese-related sulfurtransferase [Nanoarchaeota archaeon]
MKNILFYKYTNIQNLNDFKEQQFKLCKRLHLLGTILIAKEGINGCLSGNEKDTKKYMDLLDKNPKFKDVKFKVTKAHKSTFKRLSVRIRKEIVTSRLKVNLKKAAPYIEPKQLKNLLESKEDVILLDARNNYEYDIGKFKHAIHLDLDTFRQFPSKINQFKNINNIKNKKIVTYCTGGVRCEKASAFLREEGFTDVHQLHGGILAYGNEVGNEHWQGKCFVFDKRGAIEIDPNNQSELISQCILCHLPNADYHNCKLTTCDKRFIACEDCLKTLKHCCSKNCRNILYR